MRGFPFFSQSSDVRLHPLWTHGMLGMAAMSMCLSSCLTLSLLIGTRLRLPGGVFSNLIDQQCGSGVEELCYLVTCLACLRGDWASTAQGEAMVQVLPSVAVKACSTQLHSWVTVNPIPSHPRSQRCQHPQARPEEPHPRVHPAPGWAPWLSGVPQAASVRALSIPLSP